MSARILTLLIAAAMLNACGVKNDLIVPNGQPPVEDRGGEGMPVDRDPSRPPQPLGQ